MKTGLLHDRMKLFPFTAGIRKKEAKMANGKRQKKKRSPLSEAMRLELREHRSSFLVYVILRALVVVMMILQLLNRNYENVFLCGLTLLLLIIPSFVQVTFRVELPTTLEIIILLFIFAAEILGEISEFYLPVPGGSAEPERKNNFPSVPPVYGHCGVLLFHDHRGGVGVL